MIIVDIKGNIGNQMFIYAFARNIQEQTGQKIQLNISNLKKYRPDMTFCLDGFQLSDNIYIEEKKRIPWYANTYSPILRVMKKISPNLTYKILSKFGIYVWMKASLKKVEIKKRKNYYVAGYWQSLEYFQAIEAKVLKEFTAKVINESVNKTLYNTIRNTNSVCVTIRRGDYISNEVFRKKLYICDEEYFTKAMTKMSSLSKDIVFFAFSDDIEWVRENVKFPGKVYFETGKDDVFEKLRLMSACKHFILSNSSFSWWAQELSQSSQRIVVAPSRWYNDESDCAIYERDWVLIDV